MNSKAPRLLGFPLNQMELGELVDISIEGIIKKEQQVFACANPHSLATAKDDPEFSQSLLHSNHLVADGVGLAVIGRILGIHTGPRITGNDYFYALLEKLNNTAKVKLNRNARVFFFGSSEKVLKLIKQNMEYQFPNIDVCGLLSPPFGDWSEEKNREMIEFINSAKPDVLWVGMTAPKQEKWVHKNKIYLNSHVIGSIGAVFDFFAGTYPRAPEWACRLGIEWIVRLVREPKRMWRRTLVSAPRFIYMTAKIHVLKMF